mmetsp:Transcript_25754/g.53807  ORF Transcript_25754/g.53807 Transcript_25754/m.53807 type:complete len:97 (-) Transcript_25754:1225-1515(-)
MMMCACIHVRTSKIHTINMHWVVHPSSPTTRMECTSGQKTARVPTGGKMNTHGQREVIITPTSKIQKENTRAKRREATRVVAIPTPSKLPRSPKKP